jgi:trehalose 2-sulfotransferase
MLDMNNVRLNVVEYLAKLVMQRRVMEGGHEAVAGRKTAVAPRPDRNAVIYSLLQVGVWGAAPVKQMDHLPLCLLRCGQPVGVKFYPAHMIGQILMQQVENDVRIIAHKQLCYHRKIMKPTTSYIICGTPRCGSHLLCEALKNTGVAGNPDEYFIIDLEGRLENETGNIAEQFGPKTLEEFRDLVLELGSTPNGTFGIIIFGGYLHQIMRHYQQLPAYRGLNTYETLDRLFVQPKYIWLTRRDKVRQAVSLTKAMATDTWIQTKKEKSATSPQLEFNFEKLEHFRNRLEHVDQAWQTYFQTHGITPFKVVYEELVDNYEQTALEILDFLGIPRPQNVTFQERRLRKQADQLNEQWVAQYYAIKQTRRSSFRYFIWDKKNAIRRLSVRQLVRSLLGTDKL